MVRIEEIASSRVRLAIAGLLSSRPRTLGELAEATGVSAQAVLKHLKKLSDAGILSQWEMPRGKYLRSRKVYSIDSRKVADYTERDVLVAVMAEEAPSPSSTGVRRVTPEDSYEELDALALDVMMLQRRVRELSRRTARAVDQLMETELRMASIIDSLGLTDEEKQIARLVFVEEDPERVRRALKDHYGCVEPETAIKNVVRKIRRGE